MKHVLPILTCLCHFLFSLLIPTLSLYLPVESDPLTSCIRTTLRDLLRNADLCILTSTGLTKNSGDSPKSFKCHLEKHQPGHWNSWERWNAGTWTAMSEPVHCRVAIRGWFQKSEGLVGQRYCWLSVAIVSDITTLRNLKILWIPLKSLLLKCKLS